jgi:heptosyltransferase-2
MEKDHIDICGRTKLEEAIALINHCHLFVTNDSGLMHVSAALGVPTLAVFGSTDPIATGPRGPKTAVLMHDTDCSPCLKPECPTDFDCMLSLGAEQVWETMEGMKEKWG